MPENAPPPLHGSSLPPTTPIPCKKQMVGPYGDWIIYKGGNFCDFLFALQNTKTPSQKGSPQKVKTFSYWEQILEGVWNPQTKFPKSERGTKKNPVLARKLYVFDCFHFGFLLWGIK